MSESLMGPFVKMTVTLTLVIFIMGLAGSVWWANAHVDDPPEGFDMIGGWEYSMAIAEGGYLDQQHNVTSEDNCTDRSTYEFFGTPYGDDYMRYYALGADTWDGTYDDYELGGFWMDDIDDRVYVAVIRNNSNYDPSSDDDDEKYLDYFLIWDYYKTWGGLFNNVYKVYIPFSEVLGSSNGNMSIISFVTQSNYSMFIQTPNDEANFTWDLYANNYLVAMGQVYTIDDNGKTSMWTVLYWILTFDLPGTNKILDLILGIIFWMPVLFIAVTMLSRYIPTIPGG